MARSFNHARRVLGRLEHRPRHAHAGLRRAPVREVRVSGGRHLHRGDTPAGCLLLAGGLSGQAVCHRDAEALLVVARVDAVNHGDVAIETGEAVTAEVAAQCVVAVPLVERGLGGEGLGVVLGPASEGLRTPIRGEWAETPELAPRCGVRSGLCGLPRGTGTRC